MNEVFTGKEFTYDGAIYKVTDVATEGKYQGKFWAIYIRRADAAYDSDDYITYRGYMEHGDFVTDNAEFEIGEKGDIRLVKEAPGMLGLLQEIRDEKERA